MLIAIIAFLTIGILVYKTLKVTSRVARIENENHTYCKSENADNYFNKQFISNLK